MLAKTVCRLPAASVLSTCRGSSRQVRYLARTHLELLTHPTTRPHQHLRPSSSSSSTRWKARQSKDSYARSAKTAGLKSRAAFKLLEINDKYRLFKRGDTVVDLGYAPGSWSQVAFNRTAPGGRVIGIDIIPAQPPRGVSTLQGDFLSPEIREEVRRFVSDPMRGRPRATNVLGRRDDEDEGGVTAEELEKDGKGILDLERAMDGSGHHQAEASHDDADKRTVSQRQLDEADGRVVNVVLSDMMMNTSGITFKDHAGSMDLCQAALEFCYDTLSTGGHFLAKFYQGEEDKALELRLKKLFEKVHRIKPDSSRKESKEAYFVCLKRKAGVAKADVLGGG